MSVQLVSIGLPVFNGGDCLRRALDSLLAQTHSHFELIISDNASTDGVTQAITEEYARHDTRIRLTRQPVNLGAMANFQWVAQQACGDYFMWAAHDDAWSDNFIQALVERLDDSPQAVLATTRTRIAKTSRTGDTSVIVFSESPSADRWAVLDRFLDTYGCMWIYGLYRTDWLKQNAPELTRYQITGSDRLWLLDLIANHPVVGSPDALFHYSYLDGKSKDRSARTKMRDLGIEIYHMVRISLQLPSTAERFHVLRRVFWFLYWHRISRRNLVGTVVRIVKLTILGIWFGVEAMLKRIARQLRLSGKKERVLDSIPRNPQARIKVPAVR